MPARSFAAAPLCVLASVVALLAIPSTAPAVHWWQDPVAFHTNGMRLASSTSQRSHNAYWQCDPNHVGYCDGSMHGPCRNELRMLGKRPASYPLPSGPSPRSTSSDTHHGADGMEQAFGERLGLWPVDDPSGPRAARFAPAAPTPGQAPGGGQWMDALQSLGGKMMGGGEAAAP